MSSKRILAVFSLVLLASLACNLPSSEGTSLPPTATSAAEQAAAPTGTAVVPTDTPLPTQAEEVASPTSAPQPAPTTPPTSIPVPATIPPTAASPQIISFTADRTTINRGDKVTLSWQATGGTHASISWVGQNGIVNAAPGPLDPNGGSVVIAPDGPGDIRLVVRNDAGEAEAHIQLTINCPYEWMPALQGVINYSGCPEEVKEFDAAQEQFEHGFMIWRGDLRIIYVMYDTGFFRSYDDQFHEGDPESDPNLVPPEGLYQPIRGFGLVWRTYPEVRQAVGWATGPEAGYHGMAQWYSGMGLHGSMMFLQGIDGTVYRLEGMGSTWRAVK